VPIRQICEIQNRFFLKPNAKICEICEIQPKASENVITRDDEHRSQKQPKSRFSE
jgi:hypothetical protein